MGRKKKQLPRIALLGRRNVGKSTLMNTLLGRNRAITEDIPGLTRDVLETEIIKDRCHFLLSDTPGLDLESAEGLNARIIERAERHLEQMDLILFMMEPPGPAPFDYKMLELFRKSTERPVLFVVNKIDGPEKAASALTGFYESGFPDMIAVSAMTRWNVPFLLQRIEEVLPEVKTDRSESQPEERTGSTVISSYDAVDLNIAIAGRPNAGKSSLFNRLLQSELSLVSEIPGTTRDTVDSLLVYYGKTIRMIDTAGLRRRSHVDKEATPEDFFSMRRTERAIQDSDVVIHLIDAGTGITDLDKKIEAKIRKYNKPVILAVNKWDLIHDKHQNTVRDYTDRIHFLFPFAKDVPIVFISAVTGQRIGRLIEISLELLEKSRFRVPTAKLNELVSGWNAGLRGRSTASRIFYATQISTGPPEFVIFVRDAKNIPGNIVGYFENRIRDEFSLKGIPFRIHIREKKAEKQE